MAAKISTTPAATIAEQLSAAALRGALSGPLRSAFLAGSPFAGECVACGGTAGHACPIQKARERLADAAELYQLTDWGSGPRPRASPNWTLRPAVGQTYDDYVEAERAKRASPAQAPASAQAPLAPPAQAPMGKRRGYGGGGGGGGKRYRGGPS